jgi:predicted phage tail protein
MQEEHLIKVYLDGALGKVFPAEWEVCAATPARALQIINANEPKLLHWMRNNKDTYGFYRITAEFEDGRIENVGPEELRMERRVKSYRFSPEVNGSGALGEVFAGIGLIALAVFAPELLGAFAPMIFGMGVSMVLGGIINALSPQPKQGQPNTEDGSQGSYYFNGPVNTTEQGLPVPVVYGRALVGSQVISAQIDIDQINPSTTT